MASEQYDLIVVGAGSGGVAAVVSAARARLPALLFERSSLLTFR